MRSVYFGIEKYTLVKGLWIWKEKQKRAIALFLSAVTDKTLKSPDQFVYPGSGVTELDGTRLFNNAKSIFIVLSKIWKNNYVNTNIMLRLFYANVFPM